MAMVERLEVTLSLTIAGATLAIESACIVEFALDLRSYGFTGSLAFVVPSDRDVLLPRFLGPDLIEVALTVGAAALDTPAVESSRPIAVTGLVTEKAVSEGALRRYTIAFADPAQVLWTQHFPCQLYTDRSMAEVIDEQRGDRIAITYDSRTLAARQRQIFLHLPRRAGASFWDFLTWYLDDRVAVLTYDHAAARYQVRDAEPAPGSPIALFGEDVATVELHAPAVPRHETRVLNSYADSPRTDHVANAQAATGIRSDVLVTTTLAHEVDERVMREHARLIVPGPVLHLTFARWPMQPLVPGVTLELSVENPWSRDLPIVERPWRARRLRLRAAITHPPHDAVATYQVELDADLEHVDDPQPDRPPYRAPHYPGLVEGHVRGAVDDDGRLTYQVQPDDDTGLDEYQVTVPLWDDQLVRAPFEPLVGSDGCPPVGAARVLLALGLHDARIVRPLAWPPGARRPVERP